jgi:Protein of unknown function (DUF3179)
MSDKTKPSPPASHKYWVYGFLSIAYLMAALGFLFLADLTQWVIQAPRSVHISVFHLREELMFLGILAFVIAMIANYLFKLLNWKSIALHTFNFVSFFVGGFLLVTYIMFEPQQNAANFVLIKEASKHLKRDDEVMVLEINGDARAYPSKWMRQPHVVGDVVGGEDVVMTYCSLSHLGLAYSPYIDGKKVNLKVFTQLQNNLVMYDTLTDEPIQQIYGATEHTNKGMQGHPTQMMSFDSFKVIYPKGKVFFNPPDDLRDTLTRMMLRTVVNWQHELDAPVFPTIDIEQPGFEKLHPKEMVWGVSMNGSNVAYTYEYFRENNWVINTTVGETPVVLVYYPEHRTVGGFERTVDGDEITVAGVDEIDIHGASRYGKLKRISVVSEIFWMIWYTFYPDTLLMQGTVS